MHVERLWIELTERCNLSCAHCCIVRKCDDAATRLRELDAAFFCRLISEAAHLGCSGLELTGGEVLLRGDFSDVYSHAHQLNLSISVTTNGTLLSNRIADLWERHPPAKIKVSLYGWDEQSYEMVVQRPGAFRLFLSGISRLTSRGIPFKVLVPAHPVLLRHASQLRQLAIELGAEGPLSLGWELMLHVRRDPCASECIRTFRLSPTEAARQRIAFPEIVLNDIRLIRQAQQEEFQPDNRLFRCIAADKSMAVDAYGFLHPCRPLCHPDLQYDLKLGTLRQALLEHMPKVRRMRIKNPLARDHCARCVLRLACSSCPATSWIENGSLDEPSEYHCDIMHQEAYWLGLLPKGVSGWEWNGDQNAEPLVTET